MPKIEIDPTFPRLYNAEEAAIYMQGHEKRPNEEWTGDRVRYWIDSGALIPIEVGKNKRFLTDTQLRRLTQWFSKHPTDEPRHLQAAGITIDNDAETVSRIIGADEALQILGISRATLTTWQRAGEIIPVRKGRPLIFDRKAVFAILAKKAGGE